MNTIGSSNASCVTELCLHVRGFQTYGNPYDALDVLHGIVPLERQDWPDSLQLNLNFALELLDLESPNSINDNVWVPTSVEFPLDDWSEAKRRIDLVFDEKLTRLRELLKQVEEEILRKQEKGVEDTIEQLPQIVDSDDVPIEERSEDIKGHIYEVKRWRSHFFGTLLHYYVCRFGCAQGCNHGPDLRPDYSDSE